MSEPRDQNSQSDTDRARLYQSQGRLEEAEPLCQRALAIHEQTLGPDVARGLLIEHCSRWDVLTEDEF